jgi:hypothetical protein
MSKTIKDLHSILQLSSDCSRGQLNNASAYVVMQLTFLDVFWSDELSVA